MNLLARLKSLFARKARRQVRLEDLIGHTTEVICGRDVSFEIVATGTVDRLTRELTEARATIKRLTAQTS